MTISALKGYGLAALLGAGLMAAQGAGAQSSCQYIVENDWGGGATASVELTNNGDSAIDGWEVSWSYSNGSITNSWNANISGSNPYTATDMGWNGAVQPGQTVSFGIQVSSDGGTETPTISGAICDGEPPVSSSSSSSSSEPSSSSSSSDPSSSSSSNSSSSSSSSSANSCAGGGESCNWYGTYYPLCSNTESGWGWEDQQSCIGPSTCSGQPDPYGIESGGSCGSSSSSSSSSSSQSSSSSSSVPNTGECGGGNPDATVTGSPGNYEVNGSSVGSSYLNAINTALDSLSSGRNSQERVTVFADGSIGGNAIDLPSNTSFEVCGTMDVGNSGGNGAVQAIGVQNVSIPFLNMTGNPYFGLRFADVHDLHLGAIELRLDSGLGIRFERDMPGSTDVRMDNIYVSGTDNHGVETWNIDGLEIGTVTARNTGYAGLLLNNTRNANIGLVDGEGTATGTGYATLRFANENGRIGGSYPTNIHVDRVISRGGGRGFFCVSNSGGAEINHIDLADNGNNSVLIENCHNITINGGEINGGGEFRLAARSEFPNNSDITIADLDVFNTSVRESPCGDNINWINVSVQGGSYNVCN